MHRDLKLPNILVHFDEIMPGMDINEVKKVKKDRLKNTRIIIADLGFAIEMDQSTDLASTQCGTILFMAPEILEGKEYTNKVDVWSFGCMFYEMVTGIKPFNGIN
jgi:serine/threonine protein kinase